MGLRYLPKGVPDEQGRGGDAHRGVFETAEPVVESGVDIEGRAFAWRGKKVIERNIRAVKE